MACSLFPCVRVSLLHTKKLHPAVGGKIMNRLESAQKSLSDAMLRADEIRSQVVSANDRVHQCIREGVDMVMNFSTAVGAR